MSRLGRRNTTLLLLLVLCIGINLSLPGRDPSRKGWEFLPGMTESPAFEPFSSNPYLPQGKTLQEPLQGTIARGRMPLPLPGVDSETSGADLRSPLNPDDEKLLPEARRVFTNVCSPCHGMGGEGNGQVVLRGFPAPPSLRAPQARSLSDGRIFSIITLGRNNMPPYGKLLGRGDRWKAIHSGRHLQELPPEQEATGP